MAATVKVQPTTTTCEKCQSVARYTNVRTVHGGLGVGPLLPVGEGRYGAQVWPFAERLLRYEATNPERKAAAVVLGDHPVRKMLANAGREGDLYELTVAGRLGYNPLAGDVNAYEAAETLTRLLFEKKVHWPVTMNACVWRTVMSLLVLDLKTTLSMRQPRLEAEPHRHWRDVLYVCDEKGRP